LPLLDLVLDALALLQRSKSLGFDAAVMSEDVASTILGLDETEALGLIKPFNNACGHGELFVQDAGGARGAQAMESSDVAEWLGEYCSGNFDEQGRRSYRSLSTVSQYAQRGHRLRKKRYSNRPRRASATPFQATDGAAAPRHGETPVFRGL
jgi:hypothetical protein